MTTQEQLFDFIVEARRRGFNDRQIKKLLIQYKWPKKVVDDAFIKLHPRFKFKNQVCIFLSNDILLLLEKRAKKNMMTLSELIEDILRKSTIRTKTGTSSISSKVDDTLVSIFSREKRGTKNKRKKHKK